MSMGSALPFASKPNQGKESEAIGGYPKLSEPIRTLKCFYSACWWSSHRKIPTYDNLQQPTTALKYLSLRHSTEIFVTLGALTRRPLSAAIMRITARLAWGSERRSWPEGTEEEKAGVGRGRKRLREVRERVLPEELPAAGLAHGRKCRLGEVIARGVSVE